MLLARVPVRHLRTTLDNPNKNNTMNTVSEIHSLQLRGAADGTYEIVAMGEIFGVILCRPATLEEANTIIEAIYASMKPATPVEVPIQP